MCWEPSLIPTVSNAFDVRVHSLRPMLPSECSDFLTHVEPGLGGVGGIFPDFTGQTLGTVTALENLQPVGALLALLGADLPLVEHRLADFGPEMTSTAEAFNAV